jgi:thiol-disulfide isomerase/thioredoxin
MARTPSLMLPLGSPLPEFRLPETEGEVISSTDFIGSPLLVMFLSNHCPFVKLVQPELARLGENYARSKIGIIAIASNDPLQYPQDGFGPMKEEKRRAGYRFPYLFDESQEVARAFQAACTPDFFLYDKEHKLAYRGQLDGARPGNDQPNDGADLRAAIEALLQNKTPEADQKPSLGCNIKWKT